MMMLTPLHSKTKLYQNRDGFFATFSPFDKSASLANLAHYILIKTFYLQTYVILKTSHMITLLQS